MAGVGQNPNTLQESTIVDPHNAPTQVVPRAIFRSPGGNHIYYGPVEQINNYGGTAQDSVPAEQAPVQPYIPNPATVAIDAERALKQAERAKPTPLRRLGSAIIGSQTFSAVSRVAAFGIGAYASRKLGLEAVIATAAATANPVIVAAVAGGIALAFSIGAILNTPKRITNPTRMNYWTSFLLNATAGALFPGAVEALMHTIPATANVVYRALREGVTTGASYLSEILPASTPQGANVLATAVLGGATAIGTTAIADKLLTGLHRRKKQTAAKP